MSMELKADKKISEKEILTYYFNMFNDRKIAAVIDLAHYTRIKEEQPDYKTNQNGVNVTVDQLLEGQRKTIQYARENCAYVSGLLEMESKGTLARVWSDEAILTDLEKLEKSKEEKK